MSGKRPLLDLSALTAEHAAPMPEAAQRAAPPPVAVPRVTSISVGNTATENLEALAFKVSPAFRRRFRSHAVAADLKLNELLFDALDAWEEKRSLDLPK